MHYDIDAIRRRMATVRNELDEEVDSIPASVKALTSWRNIVRAYPWECMSAALLFGYVLVLPRRTLQILPPDAETWERSAAAQRSAARASGSQKSWVAQGLGLVGSLALRGVVTYASREIAKRFVDRPADMGEPP